MDNKEYRLIENTYVNRIEYEDGPGSLQNVVADVRTKVIKTWTEPSDRQKDVVIRYAKHFVPAIYEYEDPRIEYSYWLQYKDADGEWRFVTSLEPRVIRDEYEEYDDE